MHGMPLPQPGGYVPKRQVAQPLPPFGTLFCGMCTSVLLRAVDLQHAVPAVTRHAVARAGHAARLLVPVRGVGPHVVLPILEPRRRVLHLQHAALPRVQVRRAGGVGHVLSARQWLRHQVQLDHELQRLHARIEGAATVVHTDGEQSVAHPPVVFLAVLLVVRRHDGGACGGVSDLLAVRQHLGRLGGRAAAGPRVPQPGAGAGALHRLERRGGVLGRHHHLHLPGRRLVHVHSVLSWPGRPLSVELHLAARPAPVE
mmetsp:Transcript_40829/g.105596  ORF Transcript_40829/g.105596 Transcript_40829/m.105596 type:complete len:257 (+) Transcript_40829:67-837(+)